MSSVQYQTERLTLRSWKTSDRAPFALMNTDPDVMAFFPETRTRQQSDSLIDYSNTEIAEHGFGFWAVERRDSNQFIGFVGLHHCDMDLSICPCVEIGWRLARNHWGLGFATEAAHKCLALGFNEFLLNEVYSFTVVQNQRSRSVMTKIGMWDVNENFLHPLVPSDSGLQEHSVYKTTKDQWIKQTR